MLQTVMCSLQADLCRSESARPVCARVLVDRVVHLVVVCKVARAARKAVHMNVGHRLPGLLSVLHNAY